MFQCSFEKYRRRYVNYIGDGDSKTHSEVLGSKLYDESFQINKKECVGNVQKIKGKTIRKKLFLAKASLKVN